jgi:ADP-heptose:LPS heptosyltransferase
MMTDAGKTVLVHLAAGVGNIVLATPLLAALNEMGFVVDLMLDADYAETAELFRDWSSIRAVTHDKPHRGDSYDVVIPAIPPFYWKRFERSYSRDRRAVRRPPDRLFYQDEQEFYLAFARELGYPVDERPMYRLPICASDTAVTSRTLVVAPGCKTGEMALKRWPYFHELADAFEDVAVVGTVDDAFRADGTTFEFPAHVRVLLGKLSLRETAEVMASAGAVVGNDSGLTHIAGALGAPTVIIFGPTPSSTLGRFPPNVVTMRAGLECEPCWFGDRFGACGKRIDCLRGVDVRDVARVLRGLM